ncbi:MAG: riboflavin synthase [Cellvibrionaceae bacterium]|nr:riboflavin synthase [Cellvibrionaceae bacterium]
MFTGIIETTGTVVEVKSIGGDVRLTVRAAGLDWHQVQLGDSIATNGICLTVVEKLGDGFRADVSRETLSLTTLGDWRPGTAVNLEQALTPRSRLGGHIVSGHVDGIGEIVSRQGDARSERFQVRAPDVLAKYIAHKGSVTVDGTSLTVNAVKGAVFDLNIVPHTLKETVIQHYQVGTRVNLEVDVIARYLERLLMGDKAAQPDSSGITAAFLAENGFYK